MFKFKKSLGQNFLNDKNIIKKIILPQDIRGQNVLEIGPGGGSLTFEILKNSPNKLTLIEKDLFLFKSLKEKIDNNLIEFYNKDILSLDIENILTKQSVVYGNLPYNISTQILVKFIKFKTWLPKFSKLSFMFQKEVGKKIMANHNDKNYGRISVITKYRLKIKKFFFVKRNSFYPKPKIESIVVEFEPINPKIKIRNINNLEFITHLFFSKKRKKIKKTFQKLFSNHDSISKKINISLEKRPSELSPEDYFNIVNEYEKI